MVDDRPLRARRMGAVLGDEREDRTDLVESLRSSPEAGEARFIEAAARAT
jgi:hypothetical protein